MKREKLYNIRKSWLERHLPYKLTYWEDFDYTILSNIMYRKKAGRKNNNSYNDVIIMADTETSKKRNYSDDNTDNHVVAFTASLRAFDRNLVTLWGRKPSDLVKCMTMMQANMQGEETIIYFHNLAYDWVFLRKFLMQEYGTPDSQLNTKSHYPLFIKWKDRGLTLKDSLILAQRSLEKWAKDLDVEHKKSVGLWDYDKKRNQDEHFTQDELEYIEHDTLAGVECIDTLRKMLNKSLYSMPYTATGIPREEVRKRGKANRAKESFNRMAPTFEQYLKMERTYHGGFTHANRHLIDVLIDWSIVRCYDFASSYPFVLLSEKYPAEKFTKCPDCSINDILTSSNYAFMFKLILINPRLKSDHCVMPALQYSKCVKSINAITDNGRILSADYVEIYLTELDVDVINRMYTWDKHICTEVEMAIKDYLPRWLTDYIFELFEAKTKLKGGDAVAYALAKAKLNSIYGMMVQKAIKEILDEIYSSGDFEKRNENPQELYDAYLKNHNTILPYQWGVWVTAYALRNLFDLGECAGIWIYSDTDSCYGTDWDMEKLEQYNQRCKDKLIANNYGCVEFNGREYWLGVAELDGDYKEYKVMGAKRYACRDAKSDELHITVAGVPKKGVECLNDDINNFKKGFIFKGEITNKKTHSYNFIEDIYIDDQGNETGDSIDLIPCDYLLNSVNVVDWDELFNDEIEVQIYE